MERCALVRGVLVRAALVVLWGVAFVPNIGAGAERYYERKAEGWYWRKIEPLPDKPLETPIPEPLPIIPEGPEPFSPAWMREKLPEYRDLALANPTPENVRAYFLLQRYGMDMAEKFAHVAQRVVLTDPVLDENSRRPISTYGADVFDQVAREATETLAKKIASEVGVWYFYRSDCPYCKAQNPVLERLASRIGLTILPIALDGKPMPDGAFARFVPDRGHAQQLKVSQSPTLFLVKQPDQFVLLSEGLVTDDSLIERLVSAAHEAKWISDEEFNSTRPIKPSTLFVDGELPKNGLPLDAQQLAQILKIKLQ